MSRSRRLHEFRYMTIEKDPETIWTIWTPRQRSENPLSFLANGLSRSLSRCLGLSLAFPVARCSISTATFDGRRFGSDPGVLVSRAVNGKTPFPILLASRLLSPTHSRNGRGRLERHTLTAVYG